MFPPVGTICSSDLVSQLNYGLADAQRRGGEPLEVGIKINDFIR